MSVLRTLSELTACRGAALVPTMGALHEGHLSLVRQAVKAGLPVVVSVFVNPTQFEPHEDFERYPRDLDRDVELAAEAGASFVFAPDLETIYPGGHGTPMFELPAVATEPRLEDRRRPGHFAGVCQVVARLFDLARPAVAVFGEKDYQQLLVIRAMVQAQASRWDDLRIEAGPTVREADGLALSSRNRYLDPTQRDRALGLSRALAAARVAASPAEAERAMHETLETHQLAIDYAVVRDTRSLMPVDTLERAVRGLIAARIGDTRLIDSAALAGPGGQDQAIHAASLRSTPLS